MDEMNESVWQRAKQKEENVHSKQPELPMKHQKQR
jgi:hypothetical protein